jgi:hypothetical protein
VRHRVPSGFKRTLHTFRETAIPTLLDGGVTNTPSVKVLCPQKIACPYSLVCISVGLLMFCEVFSASCKIVRRWFTSYCCIMSSMIVGNIRVAYKVSAEKPEGKGTLREIDVYLLV